jgi:hypothetical protein
MCNVEYGGMGVGLVGAQCGFNAKMISCLVTKPVPPRGGAKNGGMAVIGNGMRMNRNLLRTSDRPAPRTPLML